MAVMFDEIWVHTTWLWIIPSVTMLYKMHIHQQMCHSMVLCHPTVVRIRPGSILWWILGIVREMFSLPRRLSVLHGRHTVFGSGGHGPSPRHGLVSGVLHAPGPHQHDGRLPLSPQQGKHVYRRLSRLESLCTHSAFILLELPEPKKK